MIAAGTTCDTFKCDFNVIIVSYRYFSNHPDTPYTYQNILSYNNITESSRCVETRREQKKKSRNRL